MSVSIQKVDTFPSLPKYSSYQSFDKFSDTTIWELISLSTSLYDDSELYDHIINYLHRNDLPIEDFEEGVAELIGASASSEQIRLYYDAAVNRVERNCPIKHLTMDCISILEDGGWKQADEELERYLYSVIADTEIEEKFNELQQKKKETIRLIFRDGIERPAIYRMFGIGASTCEKLYNAGATTDHLWLFVLAVIAADEKKLLERYLERNCFHIIEDKRKQYFIKEEFENYLLRDISIVSKKYKPIPGTDAFKKYLIESDNQELDYKELNSNAVIKSS